MLSDEERQATSKRNECRARMSPGEFPRFVIAPGDIDECAFGTAHSVRNFPLVASVMLVVAHGGVRFDDFEILPPPRS